jgi:hypothetical protein
MAEGLAVNRTLLCLRDLLCMMMVMMVPMVLFGGKCRHGCAKQQNTGQNGDNGFLQRYSSDERPNGRPLCF